MRSVYVGTYAKYTERNLDGAWIDPSDYVDKEDFIAACKEIHKDESDPELMFQDWEDIPKGLICEHRVEDTLWEFFALEEWEQEAVGAYFDGVDESTEIKDILERYSGKFDSLEDWAWSYIEDTGMFKGVPDEITNYFNIEAFARDCSFDMAVVEVDGYVYIFNG